MKEERSIRNAKRYNIWIVVGIIAFVIGAMLFWSGHGYINYYGGERLTLDAIGNIGMLLAIFGLFLTSVSILVRLGMKCTRA